MAETKNASAAALGMLPIDCARKGKTVNVKLPVAEMEKYLQDMNARKVNGDTLLETLSAIPDGQIPDLIVVFRNEAYILPTIPEDAKQDLAVRRALNAALGHGTVDSDGNTRSFFDVPAPTERGPKNASAATTTSNGAGEGAEGAAG